MSLSPCHDEGERWTAKGRRAGGGEGVGYLGLAGGEPFLCIVLVKYRQ